MLCLTQVSTVVRKLRIITTTGDRFPERSVDQFTGRGVFVAELEEALLRGEIDLGVHSLKDLPTTWPPGRRPTKPPGYHTWKALRRSMRGQKPQPAAAPASMPWVSPPTRAQ